MQIKDLKKESQSLGLLFNVNCSEIPYKYKSMCILCDDELGWDRGLHDLMICLLLLFISHMCVVGVEL